MLSGSKNARKHEKGRDTDKSMEGKKGVAEPDRAAGVKAGGSLPAEDAVAALVHDLDARPRKVGSVEVRAGLAGDLDSFDGGKGMVQMSAIRLEASLDGSATFGQLAVARRDPLHVLCDGQDVESAVVWLFCAAEGDHDLIACDLARVNG